MAGLAGLLGGYGSDSEGSDKEHSPGAKPLVPGGSLVAGSSEDDLQALANQPARVMDGPSANPEPPPEGQTPLARHHSINEDGEVVAEGDDGLECMLPPDLREAPTGESHPDAEKQVASLFDTRRTTGELDLTSALQKQRLYRNPDFLEKMVDLWKLNQYGTNFLPEVWNPDLPAEDYWSVLGPEVRLLDKKRAEERSKRPNIAFTSGSGQAPPQAPKTVPDPNKIRNLQAELQAKMQTMVQAGGAAAGGAAAAAGAKAGGVAAGGGAAAGSSRRAKWDQ